MHYWFTNACGSITIVSPYYEGVTLFNFVKNYGKPLESPKIYQIFGELVGTL